MKVLLDEMYPAALAACLEAVDVEATTVVAIGLAGHDDHEVFGAAVSDGYAVLTENVGDFARIAADHLGAGHHHHGLLIALSSRFSRRPAGIPALAAAIGAVSGLNLADRTVYLQPKSPADRVYRGPPLARRDRSRTGGSGGAGSRSSRPR